MGTSPIKHWTAMFRLSNRVIQVAPWSVLSQLWDSEYEPARSDRYQGSHYKYIQDYSYNLDKIENLIYSFVIIQFLVT